jgi:hypothetical protein
MISFTSEIFLLEKLKLKYVEIPVEILIQTKSDSNRQFTDSDSKLK